MLYLATTTLGAATDLDAAIAAFNGANRAVAEFIRDEVLDPLTASERVFLRRTAVLARLTAAACDAVLDTHGSGATLQWLTRAGVPTEPLDHTDVSLRLN